MFTLSDIRAEFDRLEAISGLNTKNVKIRISTRMTRTLGVCRSRTNRETKHIEIVDVAIADYLCRYGTAEEFLDTVRHEYAHLYNIVHDGVRCGHDARWKQTARWLGATPARVANYHDLLERARRGGAMPEKKKGGQPKKKDTIQVPRESAEVFRQICRLAAQGVSVGEFLLGKVLIEGGLGVIPAPEEGWTWIERAARHGEPRAIEWMQRKENAYAK